VKLDQVVNLDHQDQAVQQGQWVNQVKLDSKVTQDDQDQQEQLAQVDQLDQLAIEGQLVLQDRKDQQGQQVHQDSLVTEAVMVPQVLQALLGRLVQVDH
jgi:hypothetical protein